MPSDAVERIRMHRRILGARWVQHVAHIPRASPMWRDVARMDRHMLAGMDALVDAATTGQVEAFGEFAGRLSQEAFALQVPLDEVIRALLQIKPVILDFLEEGTAGRRLDVETVQLLNRLISVGVLEAIRRHERHRDRRALALQEQIDELRERLRRQVLVDPVTGLFNANSFAAAVRREVLRSRRFARTFTVGLVALDQEDELREALGEDGLRAVAIQLADSLTRSTRQVDVRAALGGGRFGLILPETSIDGAFVLAERLRQAIERSAFALPDHPYPMTQTVSIGLACFPRDGEDDQALLARAEEALARARAGRNTTVAAATAQDF
ncbi:MAG: GGDEF domain-containing protein [Armatimonadota bacterium]|nr:GGDEF domain-containing protein [Armatimonadota bacterium]